jgi:hypothetical protein
MESATELVRSSGLIFTGTVLERGRSTVPQLPSSPDLVVVRIDRGIRVDPVLGDLSGKDITVVPIAPEELKPGQRAVFFTNSWIHGQGIAVREVRHLDVAEERAVAQAVNDLPRVHIVERLQSAELVAHAQVARVSLVERTRFASNDAIWAKAELKILETLRGKKRAKANLYFPTSNHPKWASAPRFEEGERAILALHAPNREATPSEATLEPGALVALDPDDFQPESQRSEIEGLLGTIK